MKIKHQKKSKLLIIGIIALGVIILAAAGYFYFTGSKEQADTDNNRQTNSVDYGPPTKEQEDAGKSATNNSSDPDNVGSDRPLPPAPQPNGKGAVSVTITSPADQSSDPIQIRINIGAITNSGTCTLTLTKDGTRITKEVAVQALPSSSTCKGFDIPSSSLSPGQWMASVVFTSDTLTGTATQSIQVR